MITTSQLSTNISKSPLPAVMTVMSLVTKTWKHRKWAYICPVKIKTELFVILQYTSLNSICSFIFSVLSTWITLGVNDPREIIFAKAKELNGKLHCIWIIFFVFTNKSNNQETCCSKTFISLALTIKRTNVHCCCSMVKLSQWASSLEFVCKYRVEK